MSTPHEVAIDARWLRTGIGRYTLTLLKELKPKLPDTRLTCITMPAHRAALEPLCDRIIELSCGIYSLTEQLCLPLVARDAAVFCAPHYNVPVLRRGPMVVTIHDLTHLVFPAYRKTLRARIYANRMLRIVSARVSRIVVPSHYTRARVIEHLGTDPTKVSIIPCAVSNVFRPRCMDEAGDAVRRSHGIGVPYLLFVGSAAPHKNLITLLKAYRLLLRKHRDVPQLVLVLGPCRAADKRDAELNLLLATPGVHCLRSIPDDSLASLYSAAVITIVPSFEEGFGLPVIESMACGTPVACSRAGSLPEIAGDCAVYFDPYSEGEMVRAIERLLCSPDMRSQLARHGLERAAAFSPARAAIAYAATVCAAVEDDVRAVVLEGQHGA